MPQGMMDRTVPMKDMPVSYSAGWLAWVFKAVKEKGQFSNLILTISLDILSTISFGVLAGANSPLQPAISNAGRPASAKVGTCGKGGARNPDMASGLSLPLVI